MFVIVALVVLGVIFACGAFARDQRLADRASNQARRIQRDRYLAALRLEVLAGQR